MVLPVLVLGAEAMNPVSGVLAVVLPLALAVMIGLHLVAITDQGPGRSHRALVRATAASLLLITAAQVVPNAAELGFDLSGVASLLVIPFIGAFYGLMPAAATAVVLVLGVLVLRALRVPVSLRTTTVGMTVVAVAVTSAFTLWVTDWFRAEIAVGMAAAVAGTGVLLTARWCLVDRRV
ncbi:hypothetical protein [Umezawaea sp. NPDC059074]|uniref:hypothetical protein n=1 Tax=Umezawaea sp. NPDC059074 TaxID=3346716 RepID=UPI0036B53B25